MNQREVADLQIENARIMFRNFKGEPDKFNPTGKRTFAVFLEPDEAKVIEEAGWLVKYLKPREDGDEPQAYLNVEVKFDFFPPTVNESDLDMAWLQKVMKSKRDYYRRYREICVISMVGVYLINIVDAYVDASLAHFDISPDLSLDVTPTAIDNGIIGGRLPSLGLQCAISF